MLKIVRLTFGFVALMLNLELNRYFLQKSQKRGCAQIKSLYNAPPPTRGTTQHSSESRVG